MYRKEIIDLLKEKPMTAHELAQRFGCREKDIVDELEHIRKSLRNEGLTLEITPAVCRKCAFPFSREKIGKPGKCPRCKGTWIEEPTVRIA